MTARPRLTRATTFSHADARHCLFRPVCSSTFPRKRSARRPRGRHRRATQTPILHATTWPASTGISRFFTGQRWSDASLWSARSRRCTAPTSAFLPISRLSPTDVIRVREAERPSVPKHGSPEGLETASRQTRTTSDKASPGEMATIVDFPVQHRIVTFGQPVFARPRRLAGDRLTAAKAEFQKLLDRGIIRSSSRQWASPLHLVPKPGKTWRITGDYRLLNVRTRPIRHPLPIIKDLLQESVRKVFSIVDLYKAFYQIPVAEEDIAKAAVTTPFGLFEFLGMPLGLRNSAQTFQRTMNYLLWDLNSHIFAARRNSSFTTS
ncbi:unnamed protein product [Trichogramma brassicae]|uniref:Reverse transcriptase domain-containing protein n=1 Tax=Trichogramma brassicae TaxID=86971 RepID=A0A6H5IVK8_9HYME|nr:unnamed protein product [Trichogramma brassicae]